MPMGSSSDANTAIELSIAGMAFDMPQRFDHVTRQVGADSRRPCCTSFRARVVAQNVDLVEGYVTDLPIPHGVPTQK